MEDGLVHDSCSNRSSFEQKVLILVVVEDGLVPVCAKQVLKNGTEVLILVVVEDGLVLLINFDF